ncbi:MAG: Unknown protein [uncultured Sulfurovum sp.]|uniref:Uncharacterized protein n=1 Tax=uncultured Sulfurovum sp. TaxID=269237 RepID=A0A6S6U520_9BACT|nr:MAG: Unknown protein [uncultured Sulfurovum sp.]
MSNLKKMFIAVPILLLITACEDNYFPMPIGNGLHAVIPYKKSIDIPIVRNGITYGTVTSPYTDRVWLDRNLGASRVCESLDDYMCYGDYYQWGRKADGHEDNSENSPILAINVDNVGHDNFITSSHIHPYDWASVDINGSQRQSNWSKTDGSSLCPQGFRVPTFAELKAELLDEESAQITNRVDAFNSFLKLSTAGYKSHSTSGIFELNDMGQYWTSSPNGNVAVFLAFGEDEAASFVRYRADALSVRCILD